MNNSSSFNQQTKKILSHYAHQAKLLLSKNSYYQKLISQKQNQITDNKNLLLTYTQQNNNATAFTANLIEDISNQNQNIQTQNIILVQNNKTLRNKIQKLLDEIQLPSQFKTDLSKAKEDYFLLHNAIQEKNAEIKNLSNTLEQFTKVILYKENKREIFVYDMDFINEEYDVYLNVVQDVLLEKSKAYNKIINQQNKLSKKIKNLTAFCTNYKNNCLQKQANDLSNKKQTSLSRNERQNALVFQFNTSKSKSLISNFNNTSDNGSFLSDDSLHNVEDKKDETGIFDELNSDSENEVEFENVVIQKRYLTNYEELQNKIPKLNLKQIEYNKRKVKPGEISEKSLSRRIEHSSLRDQIYSVRFKIKLIKNKIKNKQERLKKYESKVSKVKTIFYALNSMNNINGIGSLVDVAKLKIPNLTSRSCDAMTLNNYILSARGKTQTLDEIKEELQA